MPFELDDEIEAAALRSGKTYSTWLEGVVRRELAVSAVLDARSPLGHESGAAAAVSEPGEADAWADDDDDEPVEPPQRRQSA